MKKESLKGMLLLIQTVLATAVLAIGLGYMFEKSYLTLLELILSLLVLVMAYSNYKFYKVKLATPFLVIFGVLLIIGAII